MSSNAMTTRKTETFTALNGLRFLAALAVVFFHYARKMDGYANLWPIFRSLIDLGPAAVGFFFILSGFVLAHRYLQKDSDPVAPASFGWARFARLYPAYMLAFLMFFPFAWEKYILHAAPGAGGRATFALSATLSSLMLQAWTPLAQAWNGPSWSLSVEALMYLIFPFVGARLMRLNTKKTLLVIGAGWLIPASVAVAYVSGLLTKSHWEKYVTNDPLLWTPLFLTGICGIKFLSKWKRVSDRKANVISVATLAAVVILAAAWPAAWDAVFITGGIAPLLLALIVFFSRTTGIVARIVGGWILNELGKASYVLYIIQAPLWHYWQGATNLLRGAAMDSPLVARWQFWWFIPVIVLTSVIVHNFVEKPAYEWLSGRSKSPQTGRGRSGYSTPRIEPPNVAEVA